jgi:hypothetical protein
MPHQSPSERAFASCTASELDAGFLTCDLARSAGWGTEEEFLRGKERLRRAAQDAEKTPSPEPRTSWLDLLVLR